MFLTGLLFFSHPLPVTQEVWYMMYQLVLFLRGTGKNMKNQPCLILMWVFSIASLSWLHDDSMIILGFHTRNSVARFHHFPSFSLHGRCNNGDGEDREGKEKHEWVKYFPFLSPPPMNPCNTGYPPYRGLYTSHFVSLCSFVDSVWSKKKCIQAIKFPCFKC